ncbi:hypothetical protein ACJJTC_004025 [Scirpophaga incertulas]
MTMSMSHQWFIQWSSTPSIFADINNRYQSINNWHNTNPLWSWDVTLRNDDVGDKNNYRLSSPVYNNNVNFYKPVKSNSNEASRAAGLALWLAMLGSARTQIVPADVQTPPFSTLYKWKTVDFEFPSEKHRRQAIASGKYVPENVLPLGVEVWGSRVWVTFPNWRGGVPATLGTVPREGGQESPLVTPYPDWSYHAAYNDDCTGMTSVFRLKVDTCGRLWVLDSGQINSQDELEQKCPPSVLVFDLNTDTLKRRYQIPSEYVLQDSLFSNIIIDVRATDCSDLHLYITDTWRFGLIVFRESDERFWRFSHQLFFPDPLASNFTLHGYNYQWTDGIFGLSLSPIRDYEERVLYFHSLSSYREFYINTKVLKDPAKVNNSSSEFHLLGESRGLLGQASGSAIDKKGVMFYGLVSQDSIGCWDTSKPHTKEMLGEITKDSETLIYPNDIKVDQDEQQGLWIVSNKLPLFQARRLDYNEFNYRILYVDTTEAVKGTICDPNIHFPYIA